MKVALEGMDGCGKTTIARMLSERLGYKYSNRQFRKLLKLNKDEYEDLCQRLYSTNDNLLKSIFFSLDNYISLNISENVILDRHFLSTSFWNCDKKSIGLLQDIAEIVKPDLTIILYSDEETRKKHIKMREKQGDIDDNKKMSLGYDELVMFARRYNYCFVLVDEDKMEFDEVVSTCELLIRISETLSEKELYEFCTSHQIISNIQEIKGAINNEEIDISYN